jgi:hypothetical protein
LIWKEVKEMRRLIMVFLMMFLLVGVGCLDRGGNTGPTGPTVRTATAVIYSFTADPTTISKGQSSMLSWSAGGGEDVGCWIDQGVSNDAGISGKKSVSPESTTTYTLECANATIMGSSVFKEVIVEVR